MPKCAPSLFAAMLLLVGLHDAPARAQSARTFVSAAIGDDARDCSRATPCRTFQAAHDKTLDQGEITVLDPGGYGALTIAKPISVVNDGVGEASILVSGGASGITINAPADASVNLRGLTVQGIGFGGGTGLRFNAGRALTIQNCVIRNHTGNGIEFNPAGNSSLAVTATLVADNGANGISISPQGTAVVHADLKRVGAYNNSRNGIAADGSAGTGSLDVVVADSVAANNAGVGVLANSSRATTTMMVVRSVAASNRVGLSVSLTSAATLWVGQSMITGNTFSWQSTNSGGALLMSYGDNYIDGNRDGDPPPAHVPTR